VSADGKFSWEEVECLGACANAPMAQIGKDYYEDLTAESCAGLLDSLARGEVPRPGSQEGRFASEPATGLTTLTEAHPIEKANASVALALAYGDTVERIVGEPPVAFRHGEAGAARAGGTDAGEEGETPPAHDTIRKE
jgi:NADH-quinone oxidoreductase subunit E